MNPNSNAGDAPRALPVWQAILFPALAGGLGWGIRGQYGHETGAMIAGVLVTLTLAVLFCPALRAEGVVRAAAFGTIAIGIGGSMTYGQTVGLTHDPELVGNGAALRWGMLGLAVKGAIWIGFAGAFLGLGLGGRRYRPLELAGVAGGLMGLCVLGIWLFNEPFDPAAKVLPRIYFSDDWRWEPGATLKPRREVWGGLLLALLGLLAWLRWVRRDPLGPRLALWAMLGGALGFPLGQCLQAFHAWNPAIFRSGIWVRLDPCMNWWNWMETTFGLVMGGALGLGLWLNRGRIGLPAAGQDTEVGRAGAGPEPGRLPLPVELGLMAVHVGLLTVAELMSVPAIEAAYDFGLVLAFLPLVAVAGGRWAPWLMLFPVTLLPIAGKSAAAALREFPGLPPAGIWLVLFVLPLVLAGGAVGVLERRARSGRPAGDVVRPGLMFAAWTYFGLNFAFFHFPWPWLSWTQRTPNALVFALCALGLTWLAWRRPARSNAPP